MMRIRTHTLALMGLSLLSLWLTSPFARAQSTNGTVTLVQETITAGGGRVGGGNPASIVTELGDCLGGPGGNGVFTVHTGPTLPATPITGSKLISVDGTTDEAVASVMVNGTPAAVTGTAFHAEGILLQEGPNTISVTATDLAGNSTTRSITVTLDTVPPARPTAVMPPAVTTATSYTLTGTKTPGTSIWVNGVEVVPLSDATEWTATITLTEGDNVLVIVAKDAAGNPSTNATVTVIVDNLPPVVTFAPPAKTNFTPLLLQGSVDDSKTTVTMNGTAATRAGRAFELSAPLILGPNVFHLVATSPNGYVTAADYTVILGAIPTIQAVQPPDGAKLYPGAATTIQVSATDQEGDPIQYQILVDGALLADWSAGPTQPWTPGANSVGLHTITVTVRDDYGGSHTQDAQVYVLRRPIEHP